MRSKNKSLIIYTYSAVKRVKFLYIYYKLVALSNTTLYDLGATSVLKSK